MWVITKNNSYINVSNNIINSTSNILNATLFKTKELAESYIRNHIGKKERYKFDVSNCDKQLLNNSDYNYIFLHNLTNDVNNKFNECMDDLSNNLSLLDKQQSDILHYIENSEKLDMYICWKLINKLRNIRQQRRTVKNLMITLKTNKLNENTLKDTYVLYSTNTTYNLKGFKDVKEFFKD